MNKLMSTEELLGQQVVKQGLAEYAEYLKQRIIEKRNISTGEATTRHSNKRVLQSEHR